MRISEEIGIFWRELAFKQKAAIIGFILFLIVAFVALVSLNFKGWREARHERQTRVAAERDVTDALKKAAKIAEDKAKVEKQIADLEVQRDGKVTQMEQDRISTLDARDNWVRTHNESAGENPSPESVCAKLAALGYPC